MLVLPLSKRWARLFQVHCRRTQPLEALVLQATRRRTNNAHSGVTNTMLRRNPRYRRVETCHASATRHTHVLRQSPLRFASHLTLRLETLLGCLISLILRGVSFSLLPGQIMYSTRNRPLPSFSSKRRRLPQPRVPAVLGGPVFLLPH